VLHTSRGKPNGRPEPLRYRAAVQPWFKEMDLHRIDPEHEVGRLREFLSESDPHDYLLEDIDEWARNGRLWAGVEGGSWVAFGRTHDLGRGEGWVSGLRVERSRRGQGLGVRFLSGLLCDARSTGLTELRAVIEDENLASRRLFTRLGFRPIFEMTLRRGEVGTVGSQPLRPALDGEGLGGPIGWIPSRTDRVDLLPGTDGGRFGRWDPDIVDRWIKEGKLYVGNELAVAVQVDWLHRPRTMWVNPLRGEPSALVPAIASLARALGQEEWQAYLPSTDELRRVYANLALSPHPRWGDRIHLYERVEGRPSSY
jgi:GNAT superfamily N-acetyltransferase